MNWFEASQELTDDALINAVEAMAQGERRFTTKLLGLLAEMDRRHLAEKRAFASLYVYCTEKLRFSEAVAFWRIRTARAARKFPVIFEHLSAGKLNVTTVTILAPYLEAEGGSALIDQALDKSRKEVEGVVARFAQRPARQDASTPAVSQATVEWNPRRGPVAVEHSASQPPPPAIFSFDKIEAVDGDRRRLHFDVGPETVKLLERAREVLRHKFPAATFEDIVKEALGMLLSERDPELKLKLAKENARQVLTLSRRIPYWVRREVWKRDEGRCAFVSDAGQRCGQRSWLEYDHIVPYSKGGRSDDPKNVRLLCRTHNQVAAAAHFDQPPVDQ